MRESKEIVFVGRVLDNVHGFIQYTEVEEKIMDTVLFKRLQSIKQLSIVNWVFPGAEHTRYIHSLGVMHIADKIALKLELSDKERRIIRLAGLLHDIGHYPLSHVCEYPYKKDLQCFANDTDTFCESVNRKIKNTIDGICDNTDWQYMRKSTGYHHEKMGANIVCHNKEIKELIELECGVDGPEIIANIITGNIECEKTNPLLVQILHSELDADGIDYLMRDAVFSGTSFGTFELEQLIGCMVKGEYKNKPILCINPKGIAAADQYLINSFFAFSQIVFNKHISPTEWMAEQIANWMKNNAYFATNKELVKWVKKEDVNEKYIDFTDNFFWASLQNILTNPLMNTENDVIKLFCKKLLRHNELEYEENSEVKMLSTNVQEIKAYIQSSKQYERLENSKNHIPIYSLKKMSKQIPQEIFDGLVNAEIEKSNSNLEEDIVAYDYDMLQTRRLMECICVLDGDGIRLLCDDYRSLMRINYNMTIAILRTYKLEI